MDYYLIVYSSITPATCVKRHFDKMGYILTMLHTPLSISKGGCSYCLKVRRSMARQVLQASAELMAPPKGIWQEISPGAYREVTL